jgi:hypothetical protein
LSPLGGGEVVVSVAATVVSFGLTVAGDVASFESQRQSMKAALQAALSCQEPSCFVELRASTAGSVNVDVLLTIPDVPASGSTYDPALTASAVQAAATALVSQPVGTISSTLGVAVASTNGAVQVASGVQASLIVAPPPPPPPLSSPSSAPPSPTSESTSSPTAGASDAEDFVNGTTDSQETGAPQGSSDGIAVIIGAAAGGTLAVLLLLGYALRRRRKGARTPATTAQTKAHTKVETQVHTQALGMTAEEQGSAWPGGAVGAHAAAQEAVSDNESIRLDIDAEPLSKEEPDEDDEMQDAHLGAAPDALEEGSREDADASAPCYALNFCGDAPGSGALGDAQRSPSQAQLTLGRVRSEQAALATDPTIAAAATSAVSEPAGPSFDTDGMGSDTKTDEMVSPTPMPPPLGVGPSANPRAARRADRRFRPPPSGGNASCSSDGDAPDADAVVSRI